jgi:hypothetical protein
MLRPAIAERAGSQFYLGAATDSRFGRPVGRESPLVYRAGICAYLQSRLPVFQVSALSGLLLSVDLSALSTQAVTDWPKLWSPRPPKRA